MSTRETYILATNLQDQIIGKPQNQSNSKNNTGKKNSLRK